MIHKISHQVIRALRRLEYLEAGIDSAVPIGHDSLRDDAPEPARPLAASMQQRIGAVSWSA